MKSGRSADLKKLGIDPGYRDYAGNWHDAPEETLDLVVATLTEGEETNAEAPPVKVVEVGKRPIVSGSWHLVTEDGTEIDGSGRLPQLDLGYATLTDGSGNETRLIVAPPACKSVAGIRSWGLAVQLYALRSAKSWGMGDLGDLSALAEHVRGEQGAFLLTNPLHAAIPGVPQQPSPYFPSSREFRNPLYLRVEDVPGAQRPDVDLSELAGQASALNGDRRIDRNAIWRLKEDALRRIWRSAESGPEFEAFCAEHGESLERYATFCALSDRHGRPWTSWPAELRSPENPEVKKFAAQEADDVRFHSWLQWLLDRQLEKAGTQIDLISDLAIGVDPAGADAWLWQDALALQFRVGAPPDEFNQLGQDWGLPPLHPRHLRALRFEPFIRTVRACLRHAGGLRIDHVMGLFRLFWIPEGASPADGTYVGYPWEEMLAIVALESARTGAVIIGEDLGTIEPYMRTELAKRNVLSYRLLWFEKEPPQTFPEAALAAVSTHDLPTIAGLWTGSDFEEQFRLGLDPNEESTAEISTRVGKWVNLPADAPVDQVINSTTKLMAEGSSALVAATLEDALAVEERPNYPGTIDEWPNWSLALPVFVEDLSSSEQFRATVRELREGRQCASSTESEPS